MHEKKLLKLLLAGVADIHPTAPTPIQCPATLAARIFDASWSSLRACCCDASRAARRATREAESSASRPSSAAASCSRIARSSRSLRCGAALSALLAVTLSRLVLVTLMPLVLAAEPKQHEPVES